MQPGFDNLKNLVRNISRSRLMQSGLAVSIAEMPAPLPVYSHWMSLILLVGEQSKLTFKSHFKTSAGQTLAAPIYDKSPDQIHPNQALDFMREYCNLTAGGIKHNLLQNLQLNLSLPVVCRGFDELFFVRDTDTQIHADRWRLIFGDKEIICTCTFEIESSVDLAQISDTEISQTDDSMEIELL